MTPSGTGERTGEPLECPECGGKVAWEQVQFVCLKCPWTEHQGNPPSGPRSELPKEPRGRKKKPK